MFETNRIMEHRSQLLAIRRGYERIISSIEVQRRDSVELLSVINKLETRRQIFS